MWKVVTILSSTAVFRRMSKPALACVSSALLLVVIANPSSGDDLPATTGATPLALFEQRIMPIFKSPQPASCVQCHLAGVDLKDYILPSHEQTFVSLRDQGLIDLAEPENSKILLLIEMGERDADKQARLIHEPARKAEYEAFAAWIRACCEDPRLRDLPRLAPAERARPERSDEVIRHVRKDRVLDSFIRIVWSQRMRCFPCHTPHEIDDENPQHRMAVERHKDYVAQFGDRMHIFRETPQATLQAMIEKSRESPDGQLPLINPTHPRKSLLVLKPTSKLPRKKDDGSFEPPSSAEPVSHMGGLKMHVDDPSYKAIVAWIRDYGNVLDDRYESREELPADNWHPSDRVLLLQDAPKEWPEFVRVQLFVHGWDDRQGRFNEKPLAFTQNSLTPRRIVGGPLILFRSGNSGTPDAELVSLQWRRLGSQNQRHRASPGESRRKLANQLTLI